MTDSILCPNCKHSIPLSEALSHQNSEKLNTQLAQMKLDLNEKAKKWKDEQMSKMNEDRVKLTKEVEEQVIKRTKQEMEFKLKNSQNEREELKKTNKLLHDQLLETNKLIRQLQNRDREREIEMAKKMNKERQHIEEMALKRSQEEHRLKDLEKEKVITDLKKSLEDAKRKAEQGSQQRQGEVLELEIEENLKKEFILDMIQPIAKGVIGADISQTVKNLNGKISGTIIWELKRTKAWSQQWLEKLKGDQRKVNADIAVIVSEVIPTDINKFGLLDGVWVCDFETYLGLAYALRSQLIELATLRNMHEGKQGKMETLYRYVSSVEFKHRVEAIIEAFTNMQMEVEKERRWFTQKWAREEKNLRSAIDNTIGMSGDLQSVIGKSLMEKKPMGVLPDGKEEDDKNETLF